MASRASRPSSPRPRTARSSSSEEVMQVSTAAIDKSIDARGMACPGPLMNLIGAIRQGQVGQVFEVLSSDEGSRTDIPAWITKAKQEMVQVIDEGDYARFIVRKAR